MAADGYRFTLDGMTYVADITKITLDEWVDMERATGAPPVVLVAGMNMRSAIAIKAFLWIARRHAGEDKLAFEDVNFPLFGGGFKSEPIASESAQPSAKAGRGKARSATSTDPASTPAAS